MRAQSLLVHCASCLIWMRLVDTFMNWNFKRLKNRSVNFGGVGEAAV